jgi:hypothetical protein
LRVDGEIGTALNLTVTLQEQVVDDQVVIDENGPHKAGTPADPDVIDPITVRVVLVEYWADLLVSNNPPERDSLVGIGGPVVHQNLVADVPYAIEVCIYLR